MSLFANWSGINTLLKFNNKTDDLVDLIHSTQPENVDEIIEGVFNIINEKLMEHEQFVK